MKIETLDTLGFVNVKYPPALRARVRKAMVSWKNFCSLPSAEKLKFSQGDRLRDFGYMVRTDTGHRADNKELFHISGRRVAELRARAEGIRDKRAFAFIDAIDLLITESMPLVEDFAREIENRYGLAGFEEETFAARDDWTFRYLHYFGGEMLAHPHADRGGFTLHLHESHGGGEYLGFDGKWHLWPVSGRQTIIFPSMGLQFRSEGKLKALWHRVGPTQETKRNGRYSMVAFIDFRQDHRYNDAAKRIQDFESGFNYRVPFEKFKELFIPR